MSKYFHFYYKIKTMYYLAPMIDVSTKYFRKFIRLYSKNTVLFTEMICADFILNNAKFFDRIGPFDSKTIIQLGGHEPIKIARAIGLIISQSKFREFNLNCGCPSERVQSGQFGAILMKDADLVCDIINRTYEETGIVLSIKCRNGVDDFDSFEFFSEFIRRIIEKTPCREFYIHSRKCWLKGLSPAQNRTIPPIDYTYAYRIKEKYGSDVKIILNGNIHSLERNERVDGLMIGRGAYNNIFIFNSSMSLFDKVSYIFEYLLYFETDRLSNLILKPLYFIFKGERNSRIYRQILNKCLNKSTRYLCKELKEFFIENGYTE